jgi:class 3 adenylate cyclase/tetratricopeptide (TPR) repeat protein
MICPDCGRENAADARFCSGCGLRLEGQPRREERKIVTILFADIVGSTARAERLDPEDVRAALSSYYARVRSELERYGGTVEKFIGDAVMAVFGAPIAHEDDPERAVRAALAIRDALTDSDVEVRIAVHTGEALVALDARAGEGEAMVAGDVVNSAARLQTAAPINGVLVGEATFRATERLIEYRPAPAVAAKGKSESLAAWEAVSPRARFGVDVDESAHTPLVGRASELELLSASFSRARSEGAAQLVTLVGVPGIGKSRLIAELLAVVEADPDIIWWRQGRCLPYGEGLSFWALGEMVKAQAGVLETDTGERAETKLRVAVETLIEEPGEAEWMLGHLRPLLGLHGATGDQGERFAAWRRFFEGLAEQRPAVLVFEDLHWADDGLLDFVDHLVDWAIAVPLLIVCTGRPELLERRPGWGGGKRNASTVSLSPLSDEEVALLIAGLLERAVLPAETQAEVLRRAGGNPLYAEEYIRMLREGRPPDSALPENVQGIIAARIDTLGADEKALLQDAAVIGKVFWLGAVTAVGDLPRWTAEERLHSLERREFVRRERRASVGSDVEYAFRHVLVRDVAYNQIPRSSRAEKHLAAASWIATLGDDRSEDRAEMLAHHYGAALELLEAAGLPTAQLAPAARAAFFEAGERAVALGAAEDAIPRFERALALADESQPEWPRMLLAYGAALSSARQEGLDTLEQAATALRASGDVEGAARAENELAGLLWSFGRVSESIERLHGAMEMLADRPATSEKAEVLLSYWRNLWLAGSDPSDAILDEAVNVAERLGRKDLTVTALIDRGLRHGFGEGDPVGLAEFEQAIQLAREIGSPEISRGYINLASLQWWLGDKGAMLGLHREGLAAAQRFGDVQRTRFIRGEMLLDWLSSGDWERALSESLEFIESCRASPHYMEAGARDAAASISLARDDLEGARSHLDRLTSLAGEIRDPQVTLPAHALSARFFAETGDAESARSALARACQTFDRSRTLLDPACVEAALAASDISAPEIVLPLLREASTETAWSRAVQAIVEGRLGDAAEECASAGDVFYAALATMRAAERGEPLEPGRFDEALAFFRGVDARRYLDRMELLSAAAG